MTSDSFYHPDYPFDSVFLDTSIVRYLATLPSFFFENGADIAEQAKIDGIKSEKLVADIHVLRALPDLFQRGVPHLLVLTRTVIDELPSHARPYGEELFDWVQSSGAIADYTPGNFFPEIADGLDPIDRRLYLQAAALGCDAFLTTD